VQHIKIHGQFQRFFQLKKFHGRFQRFLQIRGALLAPPGSAPDFSSPILYISSTLDLAQMTKSIYRHLNVAEISAMFVLISLNLSEN
jgi:hypothetical protein